MQISDLPSDKLGSLVNVRKPLVQAFNSARHSPNKAKILLQTVDYIARALRKHIKEQESEDTNSSSGT